MGTIKNSGNTKVYKGKNGFTSTFKKIKVNESTVWKKTGGTSRLAKKKK
jgi:hypothetical protein